MVLPPDGADKLAGRRPAHPPTPPGGAARRVCRPRVRVYTQAASRRDGVTSEAMTAPQVGSAAPDFRLPATHEQTLSLADFRGSNVVLYFYPKDSTPGCTREGQAFRDRIDAFRAANTRILGVSRDSIRSHEDFRNEQALPFDLISDPDEVACRAYDVMAEEHVYQRPVRGIERSTFLIDVDGVLRRQWRRVKIDGHADDVLAAARAL